jgi:hypothetical protein
MTPDKFVFAALLTVVSAAGAAIDAAPVPQHPSRVDVVRQVKAELVAAGEDLSSPGDATPCNPFKVTVRVAWRLRAEGVGLIRKPGGNNCRAHSVDAVMFHDGMVYDLLIGSGESNTPAWNNTDVRPPSDWEAPIDPGDIDPPPPPPPPPPPVVDLRPILTRLDALELEASRHQGQLDEHSATVSGLAMLVDAQGAAIAVLQAVKVPVSCSAALNFGATRIPISCTLK